MRCESRIVGRNDLLFVAGAIAVVAGLLFPLSAHILDVLLIFSVSLTAAVLIITFSARGALDVSGFPLLIVLATMLRMALSVASGKLILSQGNAGTIISLFGAIFVRNNCVLAILVFGVLTVVIFGTICKAARGISRTVLEFTANVVPIKQISIDGDLNADVIDKSQAAGLQEKIGREASFFVAMGGAARFILCDAVIELVVAVVNIVGGMAAGVLGGAAAGISAKTYVTLAVGAGMTTQVPALLAAVASAYFVRRSSVPPAANDGFAEEEVVERIEVVASEVASPRSAELQYGNDVSASQRGTAEPRCIESELAETANPVANVNVEAERIVCEDLEWLNEPQQAEDENEKDDLNLWAWEEIKDSDYYEAIAELIESKGNKAKTILMAAESVKELGVTVPVNVAMRLAQRKKRCLLIDLDLERDAISRVFDVDCGGPCGDKVGARAIVRETPTCIDNLWIWPANNFGKGEVEPQTQKKAFGDPDTMNVKEVIAGLESRYDHLIIYAPNIKLSADWGRIASGVQAAMLFGPGSKLEGGSISDFPNWKRPCFQNDVGNLRLLLQFHKLLISFGCAIFKPVEVLAEVS